MPEHYMFNKTASPNAPLVFAVNHLALTARYGDYYKPEFAAELIEIADADLFPLADRLLDGYWKVEHTEEERAEAFEQLPASQQRAFKVRWLVEHELPPFAGYLVCRQHARSEPAWHRLPRVRVCFRCMRPMKTTSRHRSTYGAEPATKRRTGTCRCASAG
ncbi:MAG: hypothetical protein IT379_41440 [Deltaproteobacteria bacterium]|nr:hypothetical protein [Deltaproteobacteria bacterium]